MCVKVPLPILSKSNNVLLSLTFIAFPWPHATQIHLQSVDCIMEIVA